MHGAHMVIGLDRPCHQQHMHDHGLFVILQQVVSQTIVLPPVSCYRAHAGFPNHPMNPQMPVFDMEKFTHTVETLDDDKELDSSPDTSQVPMQSADH